MEDNYGYFRADSIQSQELGTFGVIDYEIVVKISKFKIVDTIW